MYEGEEIYDALLNYNSIISNRIDVEPRVSVSILDTNNKVLEATKQGIEDSGNLAEKAIWISASIAILIALSSIFFMWYFHKKQMALDKKYRKDRQLTLIASLYSELQAISNSSIKSIISKGNLQWYKNVLSSRKKFFPGHGIWYINIQSYIGGLDNTIKGINTSRLKKDIISINQKIDLINNYLESMKGGRLPFNEKNKQELIKIINETINKVEDAKNLIQIRSD